MVDPVGVWCAPVVGKNVQDRVVAPVVFTYVAQSAVLVVVLRTARMLWEKPVQLKTKFAPETHRDDAYQGSSRVSYTRGFHLCYSILI